MAFLDRILGRSPQSTESAGRLLPAAHLAAISAFLPLRARHSVVAAADSHWCDFLLSVPGVLVVLSELNHESGPEAAKDEARSIIERALPAWGTHSITAIEVCTRFVGCSYYTLAETPHGRGDPKWLFADSLGQWVVWNLLNRTPQSARERNVARAIGTTFYPRKQDIVENGLT